jgi:hypothetical protein
MGRTGCRADGKSEALKRWTSKMCGLTWFHSCCRTRGTTMVKEVLPATSVHRVSSAHRSGCTSSGGGHHSVCWWHIWESVGRDHQSQMCMVVGSWSGGISGSRRRSSDAVSSQWPKTKSEMIRLRNRAHAGGLRAGRKSDCVTKAGSTSACKGLTQTPRLRPSVPWLIITRPGTWTDTRRQCNLSSISLICWTSSWRPGDEEDPFWTQ